MKLTTMTILKGTTLSLGGIPVQLITDTAIRIHQNNVPLVTGYDGWPVELPGQPGPDIHPLPPGSKK